MDDIVEACAKLLCIEENEDEDEDEDVEIDWQLYLLQYI